MDNKTFRRGLAGLALLSATTTGFAQGTPAPRDLPYLGPITLRVDATDFDHKLLRIHESLPVRPGRLTLLYPEWIPGEHGPTNEVKRLAGLRISAGGKALGWQRDPADLHAFRVDVPAGAQTLDIEFQQLLPHEPDGYAASLSRDVLDLQWQGTILAPAGFYASRLQIDASLRVPAGWKFASALRATGNGADEPHFERVSLETLIDSPVVAARYMKRIDLDPGSPHPIALDLFAADAASIDPTEPQLEAHRNLVRQADRLFGARHFAHYDLLLMLNDDFADIGLEHHQSSENGAKAGYFKDWSKSSIERTLLPHEFTHSWNGKFRRPRDLWAPDFNVPARNSLLWVYEGQTEYWGEVLAARSGLIDMPEMLERFARLSASVQATPGRSWRNLQDTVHDEIIAGRRQHLDWGDWTRFEDYYPEGALIWLDVDTRIRELSGGQRSLDDFARAFFGVEDGRVAPLLYDFDDVVAALARVQPFDWAAFLRGRLDSVGQDPLDGLARSGWRLVWTDQKSDFRKAVEAYRKSNNFTYSLGFSVGKEGRVGGVVWDGPAFKSGIAEGLTLVAVNLHEYNAERLEEAIATARDATAPIELLFKDGSDYRMVQIPYHGGLRYPKLERIDGTPDHLTAILSPR